VTRRPKIKAADVDWSRVARNCYQGKSGRLRTQSENRGELLVAGEQPVRGYKVEEKEEEVDPT
jgi:hypothetical protein